MRRFRASEDCQHIGINTTISKTGLNADYPVIQNKNLGTASQTLLTEVKLHLRHRLIQKKLFPGHIALNCTDKLFLLVTFQHHLK